MAFGTFAASISTYQSLVGITRFGFSDAQYAAIFMTGAVLSLCASLAVGIATDRSARRRTTVRIAALCGMLGAFGVAFTHNPLAYLVAHLVFFPASSTLFGQLFALGRLAASVYPREQRAGIQQTIRAVFCLPFLVVLPLWAVALGSGADLLAVYLVGGIAGAVTLVIFLFAWPRDGRTRWADAASGLSLGAALREMSETRVLSRVALLIGISGSVSMYMITIGLILNAVPGRGPGDAGLFVGIVAGLEVPVMLTLPRLVLRFGLTPVLCCGALVYAAFQIALPLLGPYPAVWLLLLPAGLGAGILVSLPLLYLQDLLDGRPGAGGSLISLMSLGGQVLSALVFAVATAISGYGLAITLSAMIALVAAGVLFTLDRAAQS